MKRILLAALALLACAGPVCAAPPPPKVTGAADGIFEAFRTRPLVGIAEWHGLAQELDFYAVLLRDPRFAAEVGNVVLEVGDAAQQAVIDRYVAGEDVPYTELRKVWADTVGWFPTVTFAGSINLYATIREVNRTLPPERRIKVWLGDPPIDWSAIKTKAEWQVLEDQRDSYPAALIGREILAKGKKALVIYGAGHFGIYPAYDNLRVLVEKDHPGALFIVSPYVGYAQKDCAARFAGHIKSWTAPMLATPIRGSSLEQDIWGPGCNAFARPDSAPKPLSDEQYANSGRNNLGLTSDGLLYLGPREGLLNGPHDLDIYMDSEYRAEMDRRMVLRTGEHLTGYRFGQRSVLRPFWQ